MFGFKNYVSLSYFLGFVYKYLVASIYQCAYFQNYTRKFYPVSSASHCPCVQALVNEINVTEGLF